MRLICGSEPVEEVNRARGGRGDGGSGEAGDRVRLMALVDGNEDYLGETKMGVAVDWAV